MDVSTEGIHLQACALLVPHALLFGPRRAPTAVSYCDGQSKAMNPENIPAAQAPAAERELTLNQAIDLALEHNGELQVAKLDVQHFEAMKAKARAQYLPKLTNNSDATYLTEREEWFCHPRRSEFSRLQDLYQQRP